jgi:hypothetical protein
MKRFISASRKDISLSFQHEVATLFRGIRSCNVEENVKKIGSLRLARPNGDDIGDIDVFVIDSTAEILLAIEVKDFEQARTPIELKRELDKLLEGEKSAVHHHDERLQFLQSKREQIHSELNLSGTCGDWYISGEIVTSRDLLATQLKNSRASSKTLTICSFDDLIERRNNGTLIQRPKQSSAKQRRRRKK